jgi:uncharacterized repeat protein (TIGR01451 family)
MSSSPSSTLRPPFRIKTVDLQKVQEPPGDEVTFTVAVTNNSPSGKVTITAIIDSFDEEGQQYINLTGLSGSN